MFCGNCGSEIKDTDKFCGNCGAEAHSTKIENIEEQKAQVFSNSMSKIMDTKIDITKPAENLDYIYKKKKKKRILPVALIVVGIFLITLSVFVYANKDKYFYSKEGKRTIMIYMIGSNLESDGFSATKDINEILDSNINYDDINILIYTGGARRWHTDGIPNDKQALFEINEDGLKKIDEFDATKSMIDYTNITYLLDYGYKNYDTEFYDLILWDHGGGPNFGYGDDEYADGSILIRDIVKALKESPFNGGNKLEIIGFDACLMSSVEIASALSDYSEYMIASQESEPGEGWNYKFLAKVDDDTSSLEMGKLIVDYYDDFYAKKKFINGVSLSLLKLNKTENVENSIDKLFANMDEKIIDEFSTFSRTRIKAKTFGRDSDEYYDYDLVDLKDFIDNLPEEYYEEVNSLRASLEDFVVYQKTDLLNTYGVSIFFPYESEEDVMEVSMAIYPTLNFVPTYYDFVGNFVTRLTGNQLQHWNLTKNKIVAENEGKVSVTLPQDVIDNYSSASYILFDKDEEGLFTPIFNSTDVTVEGNTLSTTVAKKSLVATNSLGDEMIVTAIVNEEGKNYVKYNIPATLSKWDKDTFDYEILSVYLEVVVDEEHPNGYVARVLPMNENEPLMTRKMEIDIKEWDTLQILSFKYNILDKSGNYITNWADSNTLVSIEFDTDEDLNLTFRDLDIANDYYCVFKVKDSQGNSYYTNIVKVNNK